MATLRELIIKVSADSGSFQREIARASRMGQDYYKTMEQGGKQAAAVTRETQRSTGLNAELVSVNLPLRAWLARLWGHLPHINLSSMPIPGTSWARSAPGFHWRGGFCSSNAR
jgi:hypothetical protein